MQRPFVYRTQIGRKYLPTVHQIFTIRHWDMLYCKYKDETVGETDAAEISADNPTAYP